MALPLKAPDSPFGSSGLTATPNRLPTVLDALELNERSESGGIYGIGLQVDPKTFEVVKINDLVLRPGINIPEMLSIGDTLLSIDDAVLGEVSNHFGWLTAIQFRCVVHRWRILLTSRFLVPQNRNTVEKLIPGPHKTFINLHFRDLETGNKFDVEVMRHVPLQVWEKKLRWYSIREPLEGQDLCADPRIVEVLEGIRESVIERSGELVDLVRYWQPDPEVNLGLRLVRSGTTDPPGQVTKVLEGSPAALLGLIRPGDEIRAVNGIKVTWSNRTSLLSSADIAARRKASLKVYRQGMLTMVVVPCTAQGNALAASQLHAAIEAVELLVSGGAEQDKVLEALRVVQEQARGMERRRLEAEVRQADSLCEAQGSIANQVLEAERLLRPIRAFTKGLDDLVPRVELDSALSDAQVLPSPPFCVFFLALRSSEAFPLSCDVQLCKSAASRLKGEVERLKALLCESVPQEELESARAEMDRLRTRFHTLLEETVPRPIHEVEVLGLGEEVRRYEALMPTLVPQEQLAAAKADAERWQAEAARLRQLADSMVSTTELDAARDRQRALADELAALTDRTRRLVSAADLAAARADADVSAAEAASLRGQVRLARRPFLTHSACLDLTPLSPIPQPQPAWSNRSGRSDELLARAPPSRCSGGAARCDAPGSRRAAGRGAGGGGRAAAGGVDKGLGGAARRDGRGDACYGRAALPAQAPGACGRAGVRAVLCVRGSMCAESDSSRCAHSPPSAFE